MKPWIVLVIAVFVLALAPTASAGRDDYCPWGGIRGESQRCFDCFERVWTGREWRWVNTCKAEPDFNLFEQR
jgi:hypothetical protein